MINENSILETINMIKLHNLDIRTVTMAISLRDCISPDINEVCGNIYNKITKYAKNLCEYAQELENDYSIPIINKRIAVTPISLIGEACKNPDYVKIAKTLDEAGRSVGVNFIGGFSALVTLSADFPRLWKKVIQKATNFLLKVFRKLLLRQNACVHQ